MEKGEPEWRKRKKIGVSRLPEEEEKYNFAMTKFDKYLNFTCPPHVQIERVVSVYHGFQIACDTCNSRMWPLRAL